MCVLFDVLVRPGNQQLPGHPQMNDKLGGMVLRGQDLARNLPALSFGAGSLQVNHDVLAHTAYCSNTGMAQGALDFGGRRLQRFGLRAQPYRLDGVSQHSARQAAYDGFDFGKLRHKTSCQLSVAGLSVQPRLSTVSCRLTTSINRRPSPSPLVSLHVHTRSEERRVGKECRTRWRPDQ